MRELEYVIEDPAEPAEYHPKPFSVMRCHPLPSPYEGFACGGDGPQTKEEVEMVIALAEAEIARRKASVNVAPKRRRGRHRNG